MIPLKTYVAAGVLAATFGAGWFAQGWRLDAKADRVARVQAEAMATANASALALQKTLDNERDAQAQRLAVIDDEQTKNLKAANDETKRLATCVANGTCGLRVNVIGPACAGAVPQAQSGGGLDSGTGARLAPAAERGYFALRDGIANAQTKLAACQASLKTISAQR